MLTNRGTGQFGALLLFSLFYLNFISYCWSLNDEGKALLKFKERVVSDPYGTLSEWGDDDLVADPCSWFGVECSAEGNVVVLDLRDLCLGGTLAPDIRNLINIKSIILRNNSFTGNIPKGIGKLRELEVLDLGYNNFTGPLPPDLGHNLSLTILLLDNNVLIGSSELQVDDLQLSNPAKGLSCIERSVTWYPSKGLSCIERSVTWSVASADNAVQKRQLQEAGAAATPKSSAPPSTYLRIDFSPPPPPVETSPVIIRPPPPMGSSTANISAPTPSPVNASAPAPDNSNVPSPVVNGSTSPILSPPTSSLTNSSHGSKHHTAIVASVVGGALFLILAVGIYFWATSKTTVKPWASGLSGQLQKALITGVPKLKRSELEAGCEDFSNVIGLSPIGTLYKGTLSSGVEIAVASVPVTSAKDWSANLEAQFRKKIETLSKVNHKNFVTLLGYCEEEEPFTRMMVFEYAPNGTLFEHLHIKESEHLDWQMRLRIAMGIAYCLDHMHQLNPPVVHSNLDSSSVHLTEDYAAKISDFGASHEIIAAKSESSGENHIDAPLPRPESNVYSFGVLLFEMITGQLPFAVGTDLLQDWASDYLRSNHPLKEMVDPTLASFDEEKLERIGEVMRSCVHPDPQRRPVVREVTARLREITGITNDAAIPKLSPLWWAELEIMSPGAS